MNQYLTVDAGGTFVKWAFMDSDGRILRRGKYPTSCSDLEAFLSAIEDLYHQNEEVRGIAMSVPGRVDAETGCHLGGGAIVAIHHTDLADLVSRRCGNVPVSVDNDGRCAARAEMISGALKDCRSGAVIILGTAVGGTVFLDRKIITGAHMFAGELSYMYYGNEAIRPDVRNTAYGEETIDMKYTGRITAGGIVRQYNKLTGSTYAVTDCPLIFEKMKQGEEAARSVIQRAARDLAMLAVNVQAVVDPDAIAIGGGISAQEEYIAMAAEAVKLYKPEDRDIFPFPDIRRCAYGIDANLIGALYNFQEKFE